MILILVTLTIVVAVAIVLAVAYHLVGVYIALKRGGDHLEALAAHLVKVRDDSLPLNGRVDEINAGLKTLAGPLLGANGNLAAIADACAALERQRTY